MQCKLINNSLYSNYQEGCFNLNKQKILIPPTIPPAIPPK